MCVIVYKPADADRPDDEELRACWDANSHGAGIMWASRNKLFTIKGLMTFDEFMAALDGIPRTVAVVMHFRIASHGAVNAENTHPWRIDAKHALVHNGIIEWLGDDKHVSDSYRLATMLTNFVSEFDNLDFRTLIERAVGSYNKVVLLDNTGKVHILNEVQGTWHQGCWFSNSGWQWRLRKSETEFEYGQKVIPFTYGNGLSVEADDAAPEVIDPEYLVCKVVPNFETMEVLLTDDNGIVIACGMDEFFCNYDLLKYSDKLKDRIEDMVIQWNLQLHHQAN